MRNFQNIQQLDSTEKVDSNLILVWALNTKAYKLVLLTDLGNQSAAIYSNIFSVKVDLSVFRN
jgi:hypothetical protein